MRVIIWSVPLPLEDAQTITVLDKVLPPAALANALSGYDIINGEPFNVIGGVSVDPGLRHQIFIGRDNVMMSKVTNCQVKATAEVVTTLEQFREVTGATSVEGTGIGFEKKGKVKAQKGPASVEMDFEV